jgi:hypothetical protein
MSDMRFGWSKKGISQRGGEKKAFLEGETGCRRGEIVFASFFVKRRLYLALPSPR